MAFAIQGVARGESDLLMHPPIGTRCFYCGKQAEHYDHKIPKAIGGANIPENLVAACAKCNCSKGTKTIDEFRRAKELEAASKQIEDLRWTKRQLAWLEERGLIKSISHVFWSEMPEHEQIRAPLLISGWGSTQPPMKLSHEDRKNMAAIVFAEIKAHKP
jgi:hypothetical protein